MPEPLITIAGLDELKAHAQASYLLYTPLRNYMKSSGNALRQALFRVSPVGKTKRFMRGWVVTIDSGDPPTTVTVKNTDPKAAMVIGGTRAHIIRPRGKKALFWVGARHPVRSVFHPGTRPNDVPAKGLAEARPEIDGPIRAAFDADVERRFTAKGGA